MHCGSVAGVKDPAFGAAGLFELVRWVVHLFWRGKSWDLMFAGNER